MREIVYAVSKVDINEGSSEIIKLCVSKPVAIHVINTMSTMDGYYYDIKEVEIE